MQKSTVLWIITGAVMGLIASLALSYMMFDTPFHGSPGLNIVAMLWGAFCFYVFNRKG